MSSINRNQSLSAHAFFSDNEKRNMVHAAFVNNTWKFEGALGFSVPQIQVYQAHGYPEGIRQAFDKWLNAGHTLQEFIDVCFSLGNIILLINLGLIDKNHQPKEVMTPPKEEISITSTNKSGVEELKSSNPFAALNIEREPDTFCQIVNQNRDIDYQAVCRILTKNGLWESWLEQQGLTGSEAIEKFTNQIRLQSKKDRSFNAAHTVFQMVIEIEKIGNMTIPEFVDSLMKMGDRDVSQVASEWIGDEIEDQSSEGIGKLRREIRLLFEEKRIFADQIRLEYALDCLLDQNIGGVRSVEDLVHVDPMDLNRSFNGVEASKFRKLIKNMDQ